jgi:chromosomal replication initiator protein
MEQGGTAQATTRSISRRLVEHIGRHSYDMWFGHTARLEVTGTCVDVAAESRFVADWIDGHFRNALDEAARAALGEAARVNLRVAPDLFEPMAAAGIANGSSGATPARRRPGDALRRLEDFVVGPCNQLAFAAARGIADGGAGEASRLFVHGECGVGKTHLLQGIARGVRARSAARRPGAVRYLTAEQFTNEYISAVRSNTVDRFRKRVRNLEVLAIDDVHFLANKTSTQNEFLHTIDALDLAGARCALASDEHPRRLGLSQALSSRLVAGMVARIDRPDPATRVKLALRLAADRGLDLSAAAAEAVAGRCSGSVRELEGAINKLAALRAVSGPSPGAEVGLVLVEQVFRDGAWRPKTPLRIDAIVDVVCARLAVSRAELMGSGRHQRVVTARGLVSWLARELTTMSYPEIAQALGRRHHSTIHSAAARIAGQLREQQRIEVGVNGHALRLDELVDQLRHEVIKAARR